MRRRTFLLSSSAAVAAATSPRPDLAKDHQRPKYHFLPAANWMNDPNGPIFWRGKYHMFYQYNPNGAFWGSMHWGHAVSTDLIHWKHLPIALPPTPGGPDKDGVFSGCAVVHNGVPTIVYTATKPETQAIATSKDRDLIRWTKDPANPVIAAPPDGMRVTGFRDPCLWRENDRWMMALGSGFPGIGGCVLLYESVDLRQWTYLHPLITGKLDPKINSKNTVATGEMWECPTFVPIGNKHLLFISTKGTTPWYIGRYEDRKFTPETEGRMDWGSYYAPISQLDQTGQRVVWGWIRERRSAEAQKTAGWSGVLSLPRSVSLRRDGQLGIAPAQQCRTLRGRVQRFANLALPDGRSQRLPGVSGDTLEINAEFDPGDAASFGLHVLAAPDLSESLTIGYDRARARLTAGESSAPLPLGGRSGLLRLTIFVDCSVVEVFANGRLCLTERFYAKPDSVEVHLWGKGGMAKAQSLEVWELKPISPDRLTS